MGKTVTKKESLILSQPEVHERIQREAYKNYETRLRMGLKGDQTTDWSVAEIVVLKELRRQKTVAKD